LALCGCSLLETPTITNSYIYAVTAILSLLLLICVCNLNQKRGVWLILLFASVFIVNAGYFALSISRTLEEALLANRISYLGSVFLPLAMEMIILNTTKLKYKKWLPGILICISLVVFLVAASPGYLDLYYQEVSLETVNGSTILDKVYGPWHMLYPVFLASYFASMVITIVIAGLKRKLESPVHAAIIAAAVFVNIGVWSLNQFVSFDFEFLAVSYIISEIFLLGCHMLVRETMALKEMASQQNPSSQAPEEPSFTLPSSGTDDSLKNQKPTLQQEYFLSGLKELTNTEQVIYDLYISRHTTREIMDTLNLKENTLKFHNKNLYSKLGVSSRKQLLALHEEIKTLQEESQWKKSEKDLMH
ncbi:MAG: hypothetical protein IKU09_09205, partial [Firmicutes bacterium]|nr:hypothetical protein [Bacillota bacterium]